MRAVSAGAVPLRRPQELFAAAAAGALESRSDSIAQPGLNHG